jgi:hypothetical protein
VWRDHDPDSTSALPRAVANGWLEVTVGANERTHLAAPDVFYFGNLIGETGGANEPDVLGVNAVDVGRVRAAQLSAGDASINNPYDFNRDGRVNVLDMGIVRSRGAVRIPLLTTVSRSFDAGEATAEAVRTGGAIALRRDYVRTLLA